MANCSTLIDIDNIELNQECSNVSSNLQSLPTTTNNNNKNHHSRPYINDVIGNLFRVVKKFEYETSHYRELILLLLHYRHMILFVRKRFENDDKNDDNNKWKEKFGENLALLMDSDLECCRSKFEMLIRGNGDSSENICENNNNNNNKPFLEFVRQKEFNHYKQQFETTLEEGSRNTVEYCPLERDTATSDGYNDYADDNHHPNFRNNLYFDNLESNFHVKQYTEYEDEVEDIRKSSSKKSNFDFKPTLNSKQRYRRQRRSLKKFMVQNEQPNSMLYNNCNDYDDDEEDNLQIDDDNLGRYIAANYRNKAAASTSTTTTLFSDNNNDLQQRQIGKDSIDDYDKHSIYLDYDEISQSENLPNVSLFIDIVSLESNTKKQFCCKIPDCGFVTEYRAEMRGHLYRHFSMTPYKCNFCPYQSNVKKHFSRHSKRTHKLCNFLYENVDLFGLLNRSGGSNDYGNFALSTTTTTISSSSVQCYCCKFPSCTFQTKQRTNLMEHLRWHLDRLPFRCRFCTKRFGNRRMGYNHWRRFHQSGDGSSLRTVEDNETMLTEFNDLNHSRLHCPIEGCLFKLQQEDLTEMIGHIEQQHELSYKVLYNNSMLGSGCSTVPENFDYDDEDDEDFDVTSNLDFDEEVEYSSHSSLEDDDYLPNVSAQKKRKISNNKLSKTKTKSKFISKKAAAADTKKNKKKALIASEMKKYPKPKSKMNLRKPIKSKPKTTGKGPKRTSGNNLNIFDVNEFGVEVIDIEDDDDEDDFDDDNYEFDEENLLNGTELQYSCSHDNCRFTSSSMIKVKAHEYRRHVKSLINCTQEFCSEVFTKLDDLNEHLMEYHGIARFSCLVEGCLKGFSNNNKLKLHVKEDHMVESSSTCTICNKSFKSQDYVIKHIRVMHMKGVFKCTHSECNFVASLRRDLDNHYYAAHPVMKKCPFEDCGQTLNSAVFSVHIRKHYNIKNYPCSWPECGKSFADSRALKDHLRIHLNFKRFRCTWPECGYASEQRANVIKHIRIRHFKLPYTKKQELELNLPHDPNAPKPADFMERLPDDIEI